MSFTPGSTAWLLFHEIRLTIRGAGARAGRQRVGLVVWLPMSVLLVMMLVMGALLGAWLIDYQVPITGQTMVIAMAGMVAAFTLMLSQTLGAATEALYQRGDLDLLFSSPIPPQRVLTVRFLAVAVNAFLIFGLLLTPVLLPIALIGHPNWLCALLVLAALALAASAAGLALAMALFKIIGPRRTRTLAQVSAAVIGAAIFLASQTRTLLGREHGTIWTDLAAWADQLAAPLPAAAAWPLRALLGDPGPLFGFLIAGVVIFVAANVLLARRFVADATAASGMEAAAERVRPAARAIFSSAPFIATLRKELQLLFRDIALLSQVLLRVLYLLPLAFLLLRSAGRGDHLAAPGAAAALSFVAGQVAGSLAWITLSAEDAPDLLASAPVRAGLLYRAKLIAALIPLSALLAPVLAILIALAPQIGVATAAGCVASALACGLINLWRQRPAKRSEFRRRRGSLWYVTVAELLVGGVIAGATALAAAASLWALAPAALALGLLLVMRQSDEQIAQALREAS